MGDVVNFQDHMTLVCPGCDHVTFNIRKSYTLECATCGAVPPIQWFFTDEPTSDLEEAKRVPF